MKIKILGFLVLSLLFGCSSKQIKVNITNTLSINRANETVEIAIPDLEKAFGHVDYKSLVVFNEKNIEIPSQLIYNGEKIPQKFIFQAKIDANSSTVYTIKIGKPNAYELKTFGRFVPERYDDYAWENDRIAFRIYGLALIPKDGPSNGIDVWMKRTDKLVIDRW